jgi:hypothetical protein
VIWGYKLRNASSLQELEGMKMDSSLELSDGMLLCSAILDF